MAAIIETFLLCDNCGNSFGVDNRGANAKEQRKDAKDNGWIHSTGKDFCSKECRDKFKSAKPLTTNK